MRKQRLFLVTIDCDLRAESIKVRNESLCALLESFSKTGLAGHATWFLNENDFNMTENHKEFILDAAAAGDSIGVHDHVDRFKTLAQPALIPFFNKSRTKVAALLANNGKPARVLCHRTGCLVQSREIYAALKELGYKTVSDVFPGERGATTDARPGFDNHLIPEGIRPYRHDEDDFLNYRTRLRIQNDEFKPYLGHFIQVPITHLYLDLDFNKLERWINISETMEFSYPPRAGNSPTVLTWDFHPYEILDKTRRKVSKERILKLNEQVKILKKKYRVEFVNLEECVARFKGILFEEEWK